MEHPSIRAQRLFAAAFNEAHRAVFGEPPYPSILSEPSSDGIVTRFYDCWAVETIGDTPPAFRITRREGFDDIEVAAVTGINPAVTAALELSAALRIRDTMLARMPEYDANDNRL